MKPPKIGSEIGFRSFKFMNFIAACASFERIILDRTQPLDFASVSQLAEMNELVQSFPPTFKWGVATSSYQIEGAAQVDGRGKSIWDTFCATPGKVVNQENGDVACDHYHLYRQDVELMRNLNIQTYRFSIAWPRLFPQGDSIRESRGFDFYDRLIDALLENDIEPCATLYHWDLPQTLQDNGGWANREIVDRFAEYSQAVVSHFGDRVSEWITLNEPWCTSWLGYMSGVHAPGITDLKQAMLAAHHTALAHAEATRAIRSVQPNAKVGLAVNLTNYIVQDETNEESMALAELMDSILNRWWLDAAVLGKYPENLIEHYGSLWTDNVSESDLSLLKVQTDFVGVNYYSDSFISTPGELDGPISDGGLFPFPQRNGSYLPEPQTDMGWPITPSGLGKLTRRIHKDWPEIPAIYITENGAAFDYPVDESDRIQDQKRVDYLHEHIKSLGQAVAAGVPVERYFAWSFLDNFEWAEGYAKRFGIVHVDFTSLERTPKDSAYYYRSLISTHMNMS